MKTRPIVLLIAYALHSALPLLHHDDFQGRPARGGCAVRLYAGAVLSCDCGEGCNDPNHRHRTPAHDPNACWVCKLLERNGPFLAQTADKLDALGFSTLCFFACRSVTSAEAGRSTPIRGPPASPLTS